MDVLYLTQGSELGSNRRTSIWIPCVRQTNHLTYSTLCLVNHNNPYSYFNIILSLSLLQLLAYPKLSISLYIGS